MVKEPGIPRDTLYTWKRQYRNVQGEPDANRIQQTVRLTNEEKLSFVIETASPSEVELGAYCRRKGFYPEQITGWKNTFVLGATSGSNKADRE